LKIEGRVKSAYYTAVVTRAYRKALDQPDGDLEDAEVRGFVQELWNVSHREFSTGFYFGDPNETLPGDARYAQRYRFMATVGRRTAENRFALDVKNGFSEGDTIEYIGPDLVSAADTAFRLFSRDGERVRSVTHHAGGEIQPGMQIEPGFLIRAPFG
jgi:putative protease